MSGTLQIKRLEDIELWIRDHSSAEFPKRILYVYYCEVCNSVLALRCSLDHLSRFLYATADECPTCNFNLEISLRCHAIYIRIPADLQTLSKRLSIFSHDIAPNTLSTLESFLKSNTIQTTATTNAKKSTKLSLSFGDNYLDELCDGTHSGQLTVLYGDKIWQPIVERLCVRAQLQNETGNLNAESVFVDGGNTFDIYHVSNYAAALRQDRDEVLRAIHISRAFTCYQLVNLIVEKLPKLIREQSKIGTVVVSNLLDLFMDSEIELNEAKHIVNFLSGFLVQFARENRIAIVVTCSGPNDYRSDLLMHFLTSRAQVVLKAELHGRETQISLQKHPVKRRASGTVMLL
jgi:hypothetical protein